VGKLSSTALNLVGIRQLITKRSCMSITSIESFRQNVFLLLPYFQKFVFVRVHLVGRTNIKTMYMEKLLFIPAIVYLEICSKEEKGWGSL
jgi:hypothetical protein